MGRGAESKLRRRNNRKNGEEDVIDMFNQDDNKNDFNGEEIPLPPGMNGEAVTDAPLPKKKKKSKKTVKSAARDDDCCDTCPRPSAPKKGEGIKTMPLIFLILMTGTTLLPAVIYASDYLGAFMAKNDVMGQIGFRMGIGAVPRKRVVSFYEKHAPEKLEDIPNILSKHYGDYPLLIKKLERKYQDYGYFLGWEEDEAPLRLALEQVQETYHTWLTSYWNRYAPQVLKTAARNIRYNLTFVYKKGRKIYRKQIWPILEPYLGVPTEREALRQKRKDAADARKQRPSSSSGRRRKNTDFRDDEE